MSRWTFPFKAGVVMALAAFVIGISAANAMAWFDQPTTPTHQDKDKGKGHNDKGDNDEDEGKGHNEKPKPQPKPETPAGQPTPPASAPPAAVPPAPVVSQGTPPAPGAPGTPEQPVQTKTVPPEQGGVPQSPVVAQAPPSQPAAPAAEREQLAKTGLDPGLIALLGALCLGGGGLLFRRALARN
jgi:LPXTG-motif cell wall-anchored protein